MVIFSSMETALQIDRGDVVAFFYEPIESLKSYKQVFIWDLDKTYLDTKWESLRGLIRTAFEKGSSKVNVPGAKTLVQSMQEVYGERLPIFFVSASPPQLERRIYEKLHLDGIQPLGFLSKDNLRNIYPGRFRHLNKQIGYKLQALMELRLRLNPDVKMVCWGDDSESDSSIYTLFSDLCGHRLTDREVRELLKQYFVLEHQIDLILELRDMLDNGDPVERVYINLADDTDPEYYAKFGRRLFVMEDSFQGAVDLYQYGYLRLEHVVKVAKDLMKNFMFSRDQLETSYDNLFRRSRLSHYVHETLTPILKKEKILYSEFEPSVSPHSLVLSVENRRSFEDLYQIPDPWVPDRIDYLDEVY